MLTILSGKVARDELKKALVAKINALREKHGASLTLAIVQVGERADSTAYINAKKRFAASIGVAVKLIQFKEDTAQEEIVGELQKLNHDKAITGIIVQLPLPGHIDKRVVLDAIDPAKDTDGISSTSVKRWSNQGLPLALAKSPRVTLGVGETTKGYPMYPATARGVGELLLFYKIQIQGKKVCVIGRSELVGAPIAAIVTKMGGIVTVCHSKTLDLMKETLAVDVIICAVGKPGLITAAHVRAGQTVIDVGINDVGGSAKLDEEIPRRRLAGDVDFEKVSAALGDKGAITPVPGGVGPMTVLALFENLIDCAVI